MSKKIKLIFTVEQDENIVNKIKEIIIALEKKGIKSTDFYTKYCYSESNIKDTYIDEFINEYNLSTGNYKVDLKILFETYNTFCDENLFNKNLNKSKFKDLISNTGITLKRHNNGYFFYINKNFNIL